VSSLAVFLAQWSALHRQRLGQVYFLNWFPITIHKDIGNLQEQVTKVEQQLALGRGLERGRPLIITRFDIIPSRSDFLQRPGSKNNGASPAGVETAAALGASGIVDLGFPVDQDNRLVLAGIKTAATTCTLFFYNAVHGRILPSGMDRKKCQKIQFIPV